MDSAFLNLPGMKILREYCRICGKDFSLVAAYFDASPASVSRYQENRVFPFHADVALERILGSKPQKIIDSYESWKDL